MITATIEIIVELSDDLRRSEHVRRKVIIRDDDSNIVGQVRDFTCNWDSSLNKYVIEKGNDETIFYADKIKMLEQETVVHVSSNNKMDEAQVCDFLQEHLHLLTCHMCGEQLENLRGSEIVGLLWRDPGDNGSNVEPPTPAATGFECMGCYSEDR